METADLPYRKLSCLAYLIALFAGLVLAVTSLSADFIFARIGSDAGLSGDVAQHIVGQRYFIADDWRWPPLLTLLLAGQTGGTNIGLTDSIPLMALITKVFRSILPSGFHTIFIWLALCYVLQPICAVSALRSAGERRLLPALTVTTIATCMPALLWRSSHSALSGHFLILLAIGLYFRICADDRGSTWAPSTILLIVSLLIHPYLLLMVAAVLVAAPTTLLLRGDPRWKQAAIVMGTGLLISFAGVDLLGYAGTQSADGFGVYSMNLLSPFYPGRSTLFPGLRSPDATGGQYEGYNYLGFGALLLAGVAGIAVVFRLSAQSVTRHAGLILVCFSLSLLALSNQVYLGRQEIADLGQFPNWVQQFRATGRFFGLWDISSSLPVSPLWREHGEPVSARSRAARRHMLADCRHQQPPREYVDKITAGAELASRRQSIAASSGVAQLSYDLPRSLRSVRSRPADVHANPAPRVRVFDSN
jgi:Family of unknown function (DUF6311)